MSKNRRLLVLLITMVLIMVFSLPVLAVDHPGQGIGMGLEKKAEKAKYEQNISMFTVMKQSKIKIRDKYIDTDLPPVIKEGRTLIPVRAITQGLGAEVDWDEDTNVVTVTKGEIIIEFDLETGKVFVNNEEVDIDVPPGKINNRVFVPLRFIAEVFGERIKYNPDNQEIEIGDEVGHIEGYVTERGTGEYIQGVVVVVLKGDKGITRAETDENGLYILEDVPIGTYTMEFSHIDYNSTSIFDVLVKEDLTTEKNAVLTRAENKTGHIRGVVTDESDGNGISNVNVRVYDGTSWDQIAVTNRAGVYTISDFPIGVYRLEFSHEDYETVMVSVTVRDGEVARIDPIMSPEIN